MSVSVQRHAFSPVGGKGGDFRSNLCRACPVVPAGRDAMLNDSKIKVFKYRKLSKSVSVFKQEEGTKIV